MRTFNPLTDKQELRDMAPEGFVYGGFDNGMFFYQKEIKGFVEKITETESKIHPTKYIVMEVLNEDLTKENLALMAKYGVTRVNTDHRQGR